MKTISLNHIYQLSVEIITNSRLRFILSDTKNSEIACRKALKKEINSFLCSDDKKLFNGRLQLRRKSDTVIEVRFKAMITGEILVADWAALTN